MNSIKILHLSTYDYGGAGKAAYRLHRNLRAAGFQSKMAVSQKKESDDDVFEVNALRHASRYRTFLTKARLKFLSKQDYYFQDQTSSILSSPEMLIRTLEYQPDLILLHWVSNFISWNDIRALSQTYRAPVIWYLLDMAPLTGGCHYAWDCTGYYHDCGMCPALSSINAYDRSYRIWQNKYLALQGIDLDVVAGSFWLEKQARNASLFRDRHISKVLLSVDPEIFTPISKTAARQRLGLPEQKKIIFFGNQGLGLRRKGMSHLVEALQILAGDPDFDRGNVLVAVAGDAPDGLHLPLENRALGFLGSDEMLALAYQAADVFVCPSIEDSGPMMINESIMSGTPVVSFDMGVAPDLVHNGMTGYRAKLGDSSDLAHGIRSILALSENRAIALSESCRETGMKLCHPRQQLNGFRQVIEENIIRHAERKEVHQGGCL